jgi:NinB protein.
MSRALVILNSRADREKVCRWAMAVAPGTRVEFKAAKRTTPQNDMMWALLTDLSTQLVWHGRRLTPDSWKLMMLDSLKRELGEALEIVPNTDGTGFVNLSTSSSDLSKEEMTMLIELIFKFGAEHGVKFQDEKEQAA